MIETAPLVSIQRLPYAPAFVLGTAKVLGMATLVISVADLLGMGCPVARQFVTLRLPGRAITLAVDERGGTYDLSGQTLAILPAVISAVRSEVAAAIRTADPQLLALLEEARLIPRRLWHPLSKAPWPDRG